MIFFLSGMFFVGVTFYFLGKNKAYGKMNWYDSLPPNEVFEIVFKDKKRVLLESKNKETFVVPVDENYVPKSLRPGDKIKFTKGVGFTRYYNPDTETW